MSAAGHRTLAFERAVDHLATAVRALCALLLALMVLFTVYTIVMRYVFHDPPFWGDTVSVFCNIWVTMLGYSLAVRDREDIALRGFYNMIPPRAAFMLEMLWTAMVLSFGVFLAWFGWIATQNVPGMFWELGGLKKSYPMFVMPLAGVLIALAAAKVLLEDALVLAGKRASRGVVGSGQEMI